MRFFLSLLGGHPVIYEKTETGRHWKRTSRVLEPFEELTKARSWLDQNIQGIMFDYFTKKVLFVRTVEGKEYSFKEYSELKDNLQIAGV